MFVDAARRYLDSLPENATGWLAGLRDRFAHPTVCFAACGWAKTFTILYRFWPFWVVGRPSNFSKLGSHFRPGAVFPCAGLSLLENAQDLTVGAFERQQIGSDQTIDFNILPAPFFIHHLFRTWRPE